MGLLKGNPLERAIDVFTEEIARWRVSPYSALYHNPNKYSVVQFARWAQRYQNLKIYRALLKAADVTGYEPVPAELLCRNGARDGYSGRSIKAGRLSFYLIKPEEMTGGLLKKYKEFKKEVTR
ncbi:MAG: hypothetical protein GX369_08370 [Euryarchaeota archaeon]|nr:hypothetical protein [Euryarchaeota archaeon]